MIFNMPEDQNKTKDDKKENKWLRL
jgi:hypothetical protein